MRIFIFIMGIFLGSTVAILMEQHIFSFDRVINFLKPSHDASVVDIPDLFIHLNEGKRLHLKIRIACADKKNAKLLTNFSMYIQQRVHDYLHLFSYQKKVCTKFLFRY